MADSLHCDCTFTEGTSNKRKNPRETENADGKRKMPKIMLSDDTDIGTVSENGI